MMRSTTHHWPLVYAARACRGGCTGLMAVAMDFASTSEDTAVAFAAGGVKAVLTCHCRPPPQVEE